MKKTKRWMALFLTAMLAVPQGMVYAEDLTDGTDSEEISMAEGTGIEEIAVEESVASDSLEDFDWRSVEAADGFETETDKDDILSSASDDADPDIVGAASGKCGDNLTWSLTDGTLTISGTGKMYDFDYESVPWADGNVKIQIKKVVLQKGVTSIGDYAFPGCISLTDISIPDTVSSIGEHSFDNCFGIKIMTIPGSVKEIKGNAFNGCTFMDIRFLGDKPSFDDNAFYYRTLYAFYPAHNPTWEKGRRSEYGGWITWVECEKDAAGNLIIPDPLPPLAHKATSGKCGPALTWKVTTDGILTISGSGAMYDYDFRTNEDGDPTFSYAPWSDQWTPIKKVNLPEGLTSIGECAFLNCKMESIVIPASVVSLGNMCLSSETLKNIYFKGNAPAFKGREGFSGLKHFENTTGTAYYAKDNSTWTKEVRQNYGGKITWVGCDKDASGNLIVSTLSATSITGVYNSVKGADIRWKAVSGATGYKVYRKRGGEGTKEVAAVNGERTTQCYDAGIKDNCWGRVYTYYVVPVAGTTEGPKSEEVVLQRLAPMTLTSVKNTAAGKAAAVWKCSVNANKANGYELQYAQSMADLSGRKGTYKAVTINGRNNLSRTITGLTKGKTYYFRIRCYVNYTNSKTGKTTKTWSQYSKVVSLRITK